MKVCKYLKSANWKVERDNSVNIIGNFIGNKHFFFGRCEVENLCHQLNESRGNFSLIWSDNGKLFAAVDHIRSIPLFYSIKQGILYISDEAEWVRREVGSLDRDKIATEEFLLSGIVTGGDTLYPDVKQLQAGELLIFDYSINRLETHRYYQFTHAKPEQLTNSERTEKLWSKLDLAFSRLLKVANGRQLVLPLSGGYDSRLIATYLKKFGYKNILTFSYGKKNNREAEYSKKVATSLGFNWEFVEYTSEKWKKAWQTPEAEKYRKLAFNYSSLPHVQDWLAIRELKHRQLIEPDAIFIPGHSGDFVAGSHIPKKVFERTSLSPKELYESIINKHLSNSPNVGENLSNFHILQERIKSRINLAFDGSPDSFANNFELWDWQERQAKYIVNSVRVYEYFGFEWYLPLWDIEFVKFWENMPLNIRRERIWFKEQIKSLYNDYRNSTSLDADLANADDLTNLEKILKKTSRLLPSDMYKYLKELWVRKKLNSHFLGFDGLVTEGNMDDYLSEGYNILGVYSKLQLEDNW